MCYSTRIENRKNLLQNIETTSNDYVVLYVVVIYLFIYDVILDWKLCLK